MYRPNDPLAGKKYGAEAAEDMLNAVYVQERHEEEESLASDYVKADYVKNDDGCLYSRPDERDEDAGGKDDSEPSISDIIEKEHDYQTNTAAGENPDQGWPGSDSLLVGGDKPDEGADGLQNSETGEEQKGSAHDPGRAKRVMLRPVEELIELFHQAGVEKKEVVDLDKKKAKIIRVRPGKRR